MSRDGHPARGAPAARGCSCWLSSYLTIQFYALIEIFAYPRRNGTLADSVRRFLIELGLPL